MRKKTTGTGTGQSATGGHDVREVSKPRAAAPNKRNVKTPKEKTLYDYYSNIRGPMTPLVGQTTLKTKKFLTLVEWPESLINAWRSGILCGKAERDAEVLSQPRAQPLSHPWAKAVKNYRPISTPEVATNSV
jgi:hypothetical protein